MGGRKRAGVTPPSWVPRTYTAYTAVVDGSGGGPAQGDGAGLSPSASDTSARTRAAEPVGANDPARSPSPRHRGGAGRAGSGRRPRTPPPISVVRDWAESMGPAFVVVFFLTQAVLTIAPVPRTVFTLSAGLLFGPAAGVAVTIAATTVSAVLALLLVRTLGRTAVQARLTHPAVKAIDARLARRGWLAVGSLRLIAPAPFALVNYCSGLSAVRLLPYTAATVVGILPGTVAVVLLGDALTGQTNPALMAVTAVCVTAGVAGLLVDTRLPVSRTADSQ